MLYKMAADGKTINLKARAHSVSTLEVALHGTYISQGIYHIFQYISNKMQLYTVYLYLGTALHVSGGTSTHDQEHIQLYLKNLVFVTPLLLPAA